jgi:hypothetical protein
MVCGKIIKSSLMIKLVLDLTNPKQKCDSGREIARDKGCDRETD